MCWPLSTFRSARSTRRARPPSTRAASKRQTLRPAAASVTAAAMPAHPPPTTAIRSVIPISRRRSICPRCLPRDPRLAKRRQRDPAVEDQEVVALDLGEQRLVDRPGDQPRPLRAPVTRGQRRECPRVEAARKLDLVRHQGFETRAGAAREQILRLDAEARQFVLRQVDASALYVFADVTDDVGDLEGDAEIARIVSGCGVDVTENFRRQEPDHAGHTMAITFEGR